MMKGDLNCHNGCYFSCYLKHFFYDFPLCKKLSAFNLNFCLGCSINVEQSFLTLFPIHVT